MPCGTTVSNNTFSFLTAVVWDMGDGKKGDSFNITLNLGADTVDNHVAFYYLFEGQDLNDGIFFYSSTNDDYTPISDTETFQLPSAASSIKIGAIILPSEIPNYTLQISCPQ